MRALYQNVLYKDSSTWYMTNKQAMLRRLLLAEATTQVAMDAGLVLPPPPVAAGSADSMSALPCVTRVYSLGREAALVASWGILTPGTSTVDEAAKRLTANDFSNFMLAEYGESQLRSSFYIVQRYIERPLLIDGRKFDLRVYLLLVPNMACSIGCDSNPGRRGFYAFYHPGFVRLSGRQYNRVSVDMSVHLTNSCVQQQEQTALGQSRRKVEPKLGGDNSWTPDPVNTCHRAVKSPMQREALALSIEVVHPGAPTDFP
uniref:Uncharacterized protein n=1 Tax=Macrostomum lignano TaxID=282301 RepID=A0A1I8F7Y6_9PLAT